MAEFQPLMFCNEVKTVYLSVLLIDFTYSFYDKSQLKYSNMKIVFFYILHFDDNSKLVSIILTAFFLKTLAVSKLDNE